MTCSAYAAMSVTMKPLCVAGVRHGRENLDRHVRHRGGGGQVAHLSGHGLGRAHEAVQRRVVDDAAHRRRVFARQDPPLSFQARPQAAGDRLGSGPGQRGQQIWRPKWPAALPF
jgi:hypothetical protein